MSIYLQGGVTSTVDTHRSSNPSSISLSSLSVMPIQRAGSGNCKINEHSSMEAPFNRAISTPWWLSNRAAKLPSSRDGETTFPSFRREKSSHASSFPAAELDLGTAQTNSKSSLSSGSVR